MWFSVLVTYVGVGNDKWTRWKCRLSFSDLFHRSKAFHFNGCFFLLVSDRRENGVVVGWCETRPHPQAQIRGQQQMLSCWAAQRLHLRGQTGRAKVKSWHEFGQSHGGPQESLTGEAVNHSSVVNLLTF